MKFFIDTANLEEIKKAREWGIIDGVTTNPSLVSKESDNFETLIKEICGVISGPVSAEVVSLDSDGMTREAKQLSTLAQNVVIKIPMTSNGIQAVYTLNKMGIKTNVTLIFNAQQSLLAAKAGAAYISPFLGRIDDLGYDSAQVLEEILTIMDNYDFETEVIAASIRHTNHVKIAALLGCDIATVPYAILEQMFIHPKTDEGIKKFLADWEKTKK